jgi:hypothetical protein
MLEGIWIGSRAHASVDASMSDGVAKFDLPGMQKGELPMVCKRPFQKSYGLRCNTVAAIANGQKSGLAGSLFRAEADNRPVQPSWTDRNGS